MSVPDIEPVKTSSGDGVNKIFDYRFRINSESEILVQHTNVDGVQKTLVLNTDYSVSGVGSKNGGNVVFPLGTSTYSILSSGEKLTRSLDLPFKQESGYDKSGGLSLLAVENSFDYQTRMAQILRRKIERCVKVNEGSGVKPSELINDLQQKAQQAREAAILASEKADTATNQATIATNKATELSSTVELVKAIGPRGQANGYAPLDSNGVVPKINLPVVDTSLASGWSMPSSRYINLTLKASGETYIAPANGYYLLEYTNQTSGTFVNLYNWSKSSFGIYNTYNTSFNTNVKVWTMCVKGDVIGTDYAGIASPVFRFIYAEGAKND